MKKSILKTNGIHRLAILLFVLFAVSQTNGQQPNRKHGLDFSQIPTRWDEAIPLGNGISGTLIWQKDGTCAWHWTVPICGTCAR